MDGEEFFQVSKTQTHGLENHYKRIHLVELFITCA